MVNLGIMFKRDYPPEQVGDFARRAEAAGFDEIWVIEDCFYAAGIAQAATALAYTDQIQVGLGIMPAVARNAAFTALEIASLARIAPQRFLPGIGHGVAAWMKQIGAFPKSPLGALEENTAAIRAILRGDVVTVDGDYVRLDEVKLEYPLEHIPPIQLGVRGPKSLQLSGRVADGTIMAEGCSPDYVRWAREQIDMGCAEANRSDSHRVTVYIHWSMDADDRVANRKVRERLAATMASENIDVYLKPLGIEDEVAALLNHGGESHLHDQMPQEWIHQFAVVGHPKKCAETIRALEAAGVDSVVLVPMMDNDSALTVYAKELMRQF